jgi:hypothetical protein
MHVRAQIRAAVVTALTGLTTTADRVYEARIYPLDDSILPGLCIYTRSESAENDGSAGAFALLRELPLVVEAYAKASPTVDGELDTIAEEVETALGSADKLGGLAKIFVGPVSSEIEVGDQDAERPSAVLRMEFRYLYSTAQSAPGVAI